MARSQLDIIINLVERGTKKNLDGIVNSITAMGIALGAAKVAGDVWRAGMEGAQLNKIAKAASSLAKSVGQDMGTIVEEIQRVSDGAISAADAMTYASKAIKLGVADTPEEIGKLVKAATQLGTALGDNVSHSVESLIIGIGRMSPLVLDNLGIMVQGGKVFDDYAASIGKAKDELTDAEKKQALLNQAITDANKIGEVQSTGFEQMDAALKDLANIIKKDLAPLIEPLASALAKLARDSITQADQLSILFRALEIGALTLEDVNALFEDVGRGALSIGDAFLIGQDAITQWNRQFDNIALAGHEAAYQVQQATAALESAPEVTPIHIDWDDGGAARGIQSIIDKLVRAQNLAEGGIQATALGIALQSKRGEFSGMLGSKLEGGFAGGANFVVPPGFPADSFPFRASSGERVIVQPASGGQSFFDNSTVNINNGTSMDAFESMLRGLA